MKEEKGKDNEGNIEEEAPGLRGFSVFVMAFLETKDGDAKGHHQEGKEVGQLVDPLVLEGNEGQWQDQKDVQTTPEDQGREKNPFPEEKAEEADEGEEGDEEGSGRSEVGTHRGIREGQIYDPDGQAQNDIQKIEECSSPTFP